MRAFSFLLVALGLSGMPAEAGAGEPVPPAAHR